MKTITLLAVAASLVAHGAEPAPLKDKTLVVWVTPATLTQQGGSALTVMEGEDFDAIVFGERQPGRWMAGSDFFRRTQTMEEQTAYPNETADGKTLVQIAIVYRGNQVTLLRNGAKLADYRVEQPRTFDDEWYALLGLRYLGEGGPIGFLHGALEEARIYDVALEAAAIAALKPNAPSTPKPIAQWTFEDGTAADTMGLFPPGVLHGGARVADGKLHLNGRDAYVLARRPLVPQSQGMFYKARSTGNMWDTWLYYHQGIYYLYHLAGPGGKWDGIAMAVSPDGVNWKEIGMVLRKAEGVTWLGTGATWASPDFAREGKFFLNFSEWRGNNQTIFFAASTNLVDWQRLGPEYEFKQDARWYKTNQGNDSRWDCIYAIPRPGGGLYGYWTANPKDFIGFGFGESLDGVKWQALAPPRIEWGQVPPPGGCEAGAVEKLGPRYYMMLGTGLKGEHGMFTLVADQPQGPFRPATKNLALLTSRGHGNTYFARFFPTPDGVLVNHHSIARDGEVSMGTLKRALVDDAGTLRLGWWPGNQKLKQHGIPVKLPMPHSGQVPSVALLETEFDARHGLVLDGTLKLPVAKESPPVGLFLAQRDNSGTAILVHAGGITELGSIRPDGTGFKAENRIDREWKFGASVNFRLLLKGSLLEFYLDDVLMQCYSLPQKATGRIGILPAGGPAAFSSLKAWQTDELHR